MKLANNILLTTFLILCIALSNIYAQTNSFYVSIKQNNKTLKIKKYQIELLRQPFDIYIEYTDKMDLTVYSSFNGNLYKDAIKDQLLFDLTDPEKQKNASSIFENDKILQTSKDKILLWEKEKTDCDSIKMNGKRYVSVKKVEKIVIPQKYVDQKTNKTKNINMSVPLAFVKDDLYLIFLYSVKDKSGDIIEVQREIVKIKWVNEYKEETKKFKKNKEKEEKLKAKIAEKKLKYKQKLEKKEKKNLEKLEKSDKKREEKLKKKAEKNKLKEEKKKKKE